MTLHFRRAPASTRTGWCNFPSASTNRGLSPVVQGRLERDCARAQCRQEGDRGALLGLEEYDERGRAPACAEAAFRRRPRDLPALSPPSRRCTKPPTPTTRPARHRPGGGRRRREPGHGGRGSRPVGARRRSVRWRTAARPGGCRSRCRRRCRSSDRLAPRRRELVGPPVGRRPSPHRRRAQGLALAVRAGEASMESARRPTRRPSPRRRRDAPTARDRRAPSSSHAPASCDSTSHAVDHVEQRALLGHPG